MIQYLEKLNLSRQMPRLFETDDLGIEFQDKTIYLHFCINGVHYYAAEHDGDNTFYGFVVAEEDFQNADWREFAFKDIQLLAENSAETAVDHDWVPVKAGAVDLIKAASNWS